VLTLAHGIGHAGGVAEAGKVRQFTVVSSECAGSSATFGRSQVIASLSKPAYVCTVGDGRAVCYHTWTDDLKSKPNGGLSEAMVFDVSVTHKNALTLTHRRHTLFLVPGKKEKDSLGYALISTWEIATETGGETTLTARTCSGVVKEGEPPARPDSANPSGGEDPSRSKEPYEGTVITAVEKKIFAVETIGGLVTVTAQKTCEDVTDTDSLVFMDPLAGCKENTFVNRRTGRACAVICKETAPPPTGEAPRKRKETQRKR
jgi:hypothetical protein